jgi:hypothetical protein
MAFRSQTATLIVLIASQFAARAQDLTFPVRHDHLHKGGEGILTFTDEIVRWEENKKPEHSRSWRYAEIQRLELAPGHVRILTYEDVGWQLGRDREYRFDHLPPDLAARVHPFLTARLDQRYLAHLADPSIAPVWEVPAKLLHGRSGSNGSLKVGANQIVFDGREHGESRTWKLSDVTNVNSSDPFELTITTIEGENRVQLKAALAGDRYQELWQTISQFHGLKVFQSNSIHEHIVR